MVIGDDNITHADIAEQRDREKLICERLGLDPAKTSGVTIEVIPGRAAVVTWEGRTRVPLSDLPALLAPRGEGE